MRVKYFIGLLLAFPLLPLLYWQGKQIRKRVPRLPEATDPSGVAKRSSASKLQLITLGESTIAGVGVDKHEIGFTGTLARTLSDQKDSEIRWSVYAKSGFTAKRVQQILVPMITEENPDLIVIGLGGNDAFKLNTPWTWKKDILGLIRALQVKFAATPILFINMPPIKDFPAFTPLIKFTIGNLVEILGHELEKVVSRFPNVYYSSETIKLEDWLEMGLTVNQPDDFFSDGVHPSPLTYQIWARETALFIEKERIILHKR